MSGMGLCPSGHGRSEATPLGSHQRSWYIGASISSSVLWGPGSATIKKWKMGTRCGCQTAASNLALEPTLPAGSSVSRGDFSVTGEKEDEDEDVKKRREKQRRRDRMRDRAADR